MGAKCEEETKKTAETKIDMKPRQEQRLEAEEEGAGRQPEEREGDEEELSSEEDRWDLRF